MSYDNEKMRLYESKFKQQNLIIDSYKLLYNIQDKLIRNKGADKKEISALEEKINIMYEGYVK